MEPVRSLIENSFAITNAAPELLSAMERVRGAAWDFFPGAQLTKQRYSTNEGEGFRAFATEYTDEPHQTDLVECFSCSVTRQSARSAFPAGAGLVLYDAMLEAQRIFASEVEKFARALLLALGLRPPPHLEFERWSRLQVNYAEMARADRDLLHVVHEDGDFLTFDFSTAPGLNVLHRSGTKKSLWPECEGRLVILAGEILSIVSGGRIGAAYHCVERRIDLDRRLAILYFADADPDLLAECSGGDASEIRERITAGWIRSGVAPVQPSARARRVERAT